MTGTAKQIAWAEEIKANAIKACDYKINWEIEYMGSADTETAKLYRIMRASAVAAFARIDDAANIIDKRHIFDPSAIHSKVRQFTTLIHNGKITMDKIVELNGLTNY